MRKLLLSLVLSAAGIAAHGFEDPQLALAAAQYRQQVLAAGPAADAGDAGAAPLAGLLVARQARRLTRQQRWDQAIARWRDAIARGADETETWLGLAQAWHGKQPKPPAAEILRAAYNAYTTAVADSERAEALFALGEYYERQERFRKAMDAYAEALGLQDDPAYRERLQALRRRHAFHFTGSEVEAETEQPRICLRFSAPLIEAKGRGATPRYEDYLVFDPRIQARVSARGSSLCVAGVEHGRAYRLTVRAGLPAADGERTARAQEFTLVVPDRAPSVGFRGSAYLLPRQGPRNLTVTTVNVSRVEVRLLRINDRNLIRQINERRITEPLDGYRIRELAERTGTALWQGEMDIHSLKNREVVTGIPVGTLLGDPQPGIYVVTARAADSERYDHLAQATQWLVVSDLGLTTLQGEDGLHVFVRSLADAEPLADVEVRLYARNNGELGRSRSDAAGRVHFAPGLLRGDGGDRPAALMAYSDGGDFVFLDLTAPAFDLGDRGVAGRPAPGPIDAYLYSDRGVYRPGEQVQLMTLLRDARGYALEGLPPTLKLLRPDGVPARTLHPVDAGAGGAHSVLTTADTDRTGTWKVEAYVDPEADPVGSLELRLEDYVPQRLKLTLESAAEDLLPGRRVDVQAAADYLYGAPAAQLPTHAEIVLRRLQNPYPAYPDYHFGLAQETWTAQRIPLPEGVTDAAGKAVVPVYLERRPSTSLPLKAELRVSVSDPGGRPVTRTLSLPYRLQPFAIGIRPSFADARLAEGKPAGFQVLALDQRGTPLTLPGLRYELLRERVRYHWYQRNQRWDYKLVVEDGEPMASGALQLRPGTPARMERSGLPWGRYRLEVYDPQTGIASSLRFRVGWHAGPEAGDTPDKLLVTLERGDYKPGETARVHVRAPFAGKLLLGVAGDRLHSTSEHDLPAGGTTIEVPVRADWSPGVYLLANAFRPAPPPGELGHGQAGPGRAVGVAWLALDTASRTLEVDLQLPEVARPRQRIQVPVQVRGGKPEEPVYLTLAAVDEGILQLTDFPTPDPVDYFLGKRRLGVEQRDLYGRLITPARGRIGKLRSGAGMDSRQMAGLQVHSTESVALFQGPLRLDAAGYTQVPLDLPDFNGRLRLMAVAYSREALGQAEAPLTVREPVTAQLYLPRFLAPDDRAEIALHLQALDAPPGDYRIRIETEGEVSLEGETRALLRVDPSSDRAPASLSRTLTLRGGDPGIGHLNLKVEGPDGFSLQRSRRIQVRPARAITEERIAGRLLPGADLRIDAALLEDLYPDTARLHIAFSAQPELDVPGLLDELDRYPYGCTEQATSRALPLLYADRLTRRWGIEPRPDTRAQVQRAIPHLLSRQQADGGFNLWGRDDPAGQWLAAYAADFLLRAAQDRYAVPSSALERAMGFLQRVVDHSDYEQPAALAARAYALYVLAKAHEARLGDLRYLLDNYLSRLPSPLACAQLGAALHSYGDTARARQAMQRAVAAPARAEHLQDYGSPLRDRAAVLALLAESGVGSDEIPELADRLAADFDAQEWTSTQEKAWLLLAAEALTPAAADLSLSLDGRSATEPGQRRLLLAPSLADIRRGLTVRNLSPAPAWYRVGLSGVPRSDPPAERSGYSIARSYFRLDGAPADPREVRQNDLLVAVIQGRALSAAHPHTLVVDLLPAGLEIENAQLSGGRSGTDLSWLPELTATRHTGLRDDRYVAALTLEKGEELRLAYLVRAVTPGDYRIPAVLVEDMYRPAQRGRGTPGTLRVSGGEQCQSRQAEAGTQRPGRMARRLGDRPSTVRDSR